MQTIITNEYRCDCGKLLFKGFLLDSKLEIKCKRCQKIKKIKSMYRGLARQSDYSIVYDRHANVVDASQSVLKFLGYTVPEIKRLRASDINPLLSHDVLKRAWEFAAQSDNYLHWESYHRKKDGHKIHVDARMNVYSFNNEERIFFLFKVLPEFPDENEKSVNEGKTIPLRDFEIEIDWRGQIIYSSPEVEKILGYKPIDIFAQSIFEHIPYDKSDMKPDKLRELQKAGKAFYLKKNALKRKDGKVLNLRSFFRPIFDENDEVWGFRGSHWIKK